MPNKNEKRNRRERSGKCGRDAEKSEKCDRECDDCKSRGEEGCRCTCAQCVMASLTPCHAPILCKPLELIHTPIPNVTPQFTSVPPFNTGGGNGGFGLAPASIISQSMSTMIRNVLSSGQTAIVTNAPTPTPTTTTNA